MMVQMKLNCHNFCNHAVEIEFHQYGTVMCMYVAVQFLVWLITFQSS